MNARLFPGFALVLSSVLAGCSSIKQAQNWPVFYDAESGPDHLYISREPEALDFYTNEIPGWNYNLRVPAAAISSAKVRNLGETDGLQAIEVRLSVTDMYYNHALMILEEVRPGRFLPVYVQDYNTQTRSPGENLIEKQQDKLVIEAGMDYSGMGDFHNHYKIELSRNHDPEITGSFY